MKTEIPELRCARCGKKPDELEYAAMAADEGDGVTADEYCWVEEGTMNRDPSSPAYGLFLDDGCYIEAGCPTARGPRGWVVPGNWQDQPWFPG